MKIKPITSANFKSIVLKPANQKVNEPVKAPGLLITSTACLGIYNSPVVKHRPKKVSSEEIEKKFIELGYVKDDKGTLTKKLTPEELSDLREKHKPFVYYYQFEYEGSYEKMEHDPYFKIFKKIIEKPIKKNRLHNFENFINIDKGIGRRMFEKDFEKLYMLFSILSLNDSIPDLKFICKEDKKNFKIIENLLNADINDKLIHVLLSFKTTGYLSINSALRKKGEIKYYDIESYIQEKINILSSFLDKQILPQNIRLYRGEGYDILENVKLLNGETINLAQIMEDAAKNNNQEEIMQIKNLIKNNKITVIQPSFMSTTSDSGIAEKHLVEPLINEKDGIFWTFELEPDTKGAYVEALNLDRSFSDEKEFLLNKNVKIEIQEADFDEYNKYWVIKAKISN